MLFFQIRPEFTSELRLRAHLFAAHFACLNQEADKASAGIGFALDHYQKAAPAPIFLSKQMFLWSSTHQMSGATLREKKKKSSLPVPASLSSGTACVDPKILPRMAGCGDGACCGFFGGPSLLRTVH